MYFASNYARTAKKRVACTLVTTDGERHEGSFFCAGDQRIKDVLNGDSPFVAFEASYGAIYLVNRLAIAHVQPHDAARDRPAPAASESLSARPMAVTG